MNPTGANEFSDSPTQSDSLSHSVAFIVFYLSNSLLLASLRNAPRNQKWSANPR
jgi:hypothetical protein